MENLDTIWLDFTKPSKHLNVDAALFCQYNYNKYCCGNP